MAQSSFLATGTRVTKNTGAPTVRDMAVALFRIPRFSGNGWVWFPVALHSFVVADLLPDRLKVYGLIHDGPEAVGSDIPSPFKTWWTKRFENALFRRILAQEGLPELSREDTARVKVADRAALHGEMWTVGPPGYSRIKEYSRRFPVAEALTKKYEREFPPEVCIRRGASGPREFVRRFNLYRALASGKLVG